VGKYRCALIKYFDEHRVEESAAALHFKLPTTQECSDEDSLQMNAVDRDISRGMVAAAKKCKRKFRHAWSPVLKKLQQTVTYWKSWLTEIRTKKWLGLERASILTTTDRTPTGSSSAKRDWESTESSQTRN
jgi:hypothetical protein